MNRLITLLLPLGAVMVSSDHFVDPKLLDVPEIHRLDSLISESYLLRHSFLRCFEGGDFANMTEAASIFALNHYVYSKNFIDYLRTVAAKIESEEIKRPILDNIAEEKGNYESEDVDTLSAMGIEEEWYNKIPHKQLSQRFFESLGIDPASIPAVESGEGVLAESEEDGPGELFTKFMLNLYGESNVCESLAVIGFAIEESVSRLYEFIWNGLRDHTPLTGDQIVFFPLHILIDDGHADLLKLGFKHFLQNQPALCEGAETVIRDVLRRRIKMYDDIRAEIEAKQGHRCSLPYDHDADVVVDEVRGVDNEATVIMEVEVDSAVKRAEAETLRMGQPETAKWSLTEKMAISARILAKQGHGETLSGQITCRNGDGTMWVNQYGVPFDVVTASDFLRVDGGLNVIEGDGFPNRATRFHHHVYAKRPDIQCIVHSHPPAASALSVIGEELFISHMDVMAFYEDVQYLANWPGIPFGDEEGDLISGVLAPSYWSALLAHHGLIVGGRSVEEAVYRAYFFERAARMQLDAMAAVGGDMDRLKRTRPELSRKARDWRISEGPVRAHWNGWAQLIAQDERVMMDCDCERDCNRLNCNAM